jgi:hypothetical protein
MPKKKVTSKRKVRSKNSVYSKSKSKVFLLVSGIIILIGLAAFITINKLGTTSPFLTKSSPAKALVNDSKRSRQFTVDNKGATFHAYDSRKVLISVYVPPGAITKGQVFSVTPVISDDTTQTGVIIVPEGYKFKKPISVSFDFSKSDLKNNAPETLRDFAVHETGTSHVYSFNKLTKDLTPVLISRGTEAASYISARTLFTGSYYVRLNDKDQIALARKTVDDKNAYFYSVIEAATTLVYNNQKLNTEEVTSVHNAIGRITKKSNPPLFELYAALLLQKKLDATVSFVTRAYAYDSELRGQLKKACGEKDHSLETYIIAALLADMNGINDISGECKSTLNSVVPQKVAALINDPNATFEEVVTMLTQVKSIEGINSPLVAQLEQKLQKVVERDVHTATGGNSNSSMRDAVLGEMDFANVDPALQDKLRSVQANDAKKELDTLLADSCPTKGELEWGKVTATQFNLTTYVDKIDKLIAKNQDCKGVGGKQSKPGDPPPPIGGNNPPVPPKAVNQCLDINEYGFRSLTSEGDDYTCRYCYDVIANDKILYSDCEIGTGVDYCQALENGLEQQACKYNDITPGPIFGDDNPPIVPPDYGADPPLADPDSGDTVQDNGSNTDDLPLEDPGDHQSGDNNDLDLPLE